MTRDLIPFERGSYEWEKERGRRKLEKHKLDYQWRMKRTFSNVKSRCKNNGWQLDFDSEYLIYLWESQDGRCALTGIEFDLEIVDTYRNPNGPSIDRIDSTKGYTKNNVRLVTTQVNLALNNFGIVSFREMCNRFVEYDKGVD